jgi:hypothetical protein
MLPREILQTVLEGIMGSNAVYFQPPPTVLMTYPCIVYERSRSDTKFSGNYPYQYTQMYTITLIDSDPDTTFFDRVAALPMCLFDRHFTSDNLNHDVFNIYF